MNAFNGTTLEVPLVNIVDGDTIKVDLPGGTTENIRILCLDTEEKPGSGGNKPKTPWGQKATERAEAFFEGAQQVTLEFPGTESVEVCLQKYRGNFNRVLAFVYLDGVDFQETMIREGYSPYFTKYGNANFNDNHHRYVNAESEAQMAHIGVWDQITVNGEDMRNYPLLSTWWNLRAILIDGYRSHLADGKTIYNTRLDYPLIVEKAHQGKTVTLFTEVHSLVTINNDSIGFVDIGSRTQRFTLFLPGLDQPEGLKLKNLLEQRYIAQGPDDSNPRRSYLYVTGALSLHNDDPQMVVTSVNQMADNFAAGNDHPSPIKEVSIVAALPNPTGPDSGKETVTLKNMTDTDISLQGWKLSDRANNNMILGEISLPSGAAEEVTVQGRLSLNNTGDDIILIDVEGNEIDKVSYDQSQAKQGMPVFF